MPTLVTAFAVLTGGEGIPDVSAYIKFYSKEAGIWKLEADTGSEFAGCAFSVAAIHGSPTPNEVWYLAWGMVIGDTGARLKMRLYAFDGASVRTVWEQSGLRGGHVSVSGNQITLDYDEFAPQGTLAPPMHVIKILHPGIQGLEQ